METQAAVLHDARATAGPDRAWTSRGSPRAYLEGTVRLDELITLRLPLGRINDGFAAMERGEVTRAVVVL